MSLRSTVKRALLGMGHYARRLRRTSFPGVAVLCYHGIRIGREPAGSLPSEGLHVLADEFAAHCRLIRETCHPIGLDRWRQALAGGPPLPERPVLLTFDDGYRSFLLALDILEKLELPAVLFASTGPIESRTALWFDAAGRAWGEGEVERLKQLPYAAWRERIGPLAVRIEDGDPAAPLRLSEVAALAGARGLEIGGHTVSHPILSRATREEQREEIEGGQRALRAWLGKAVTSFAYPNGRPGIDYNAESVEAVRAAGFDFGFTTRQQFAAPDEPPLERSRFLMLAGISAEELAHRLCYSWMSAQPASAS